ncbi:methyltransferase [Maricaulaceae bacterium MS644]
MGLGAALGDLRNRVVADPGFRRFAKGFPLTRAKARGEARALFDLMAGFVYSQTLLACVEISLFEFLKTGPKSLDEIAAQSGLPRAGAERLARAAASLNLLEARSGERYALGGLGAAMVGDAGLAAMTEHHRLLYKDLADPLALLRGETDGALAGFWGYGREAVDSGRPDAYSALMAATLPMVADEIFAACDLRRHARVLDVGGGEGAFLTEVARRAPRLELSLFDLPPVAERARLRLAEAGLSKRAVVHGGSFVTDSLPGGADLITLVRILHDHGDEEVMGLLRACRESIAPGGTLLVAEPMAGARGAEPMGEAYFGFYLMAMGRGRPRSAERLKAMLSEAGFTGARLHKSRMPLIANILTAFPDESVNQN